MDDIFYLADATSRNGTLVSFNDQPGLKPTSAYLSAEAHLALTDHLVQGGMATFDAEQTLTAISPDLYEALSSHQYGTPSRLAFHTEGDVTVSIEHGASSPGPISVSMDTLHDLLVQGVPYEGLEAVRDGLGAEGAHLSDLALLDTFSHAVIEQVGAAGYPYNAVRDVQQVLQQHVHLSGGFATVSRSEALQALVAASTPEQHTALILDNGNGRDISVSMEVLHNVLEAQPRVEVMSGFPQASGPEYHRVMGW